MIFQTPRNKRRSQKSEIVKNSPSGRSMGARGKAFFDARRIGLRGKLLTRPTLRMRANIERSAGDFRTVLKASVPVPAIQRAPTSSLFSISLPARDDSIPLSFSFDLNKPSVNPLTCAAQAWPTVKCRLTRSSLIEIEGEGDPWQAKYSRRR